MAIRRFGVEAAIQGVGKFLNDLGKMARGYDAISKSAEKAQKSANSLGSALDRANQKALTSSNQLASAQRAVENASIRNQAAIAKVAAAQERHNAVILKASQVLTNQQSTILQLAKANDQLTASQTKLAQAQGQAQIAANNLADAQQKLAAAQLGGEQATQRVQQLGSQFGETSTAAASLAGEAAQVGVIFNALGVAALAAAAGLKILGVAFSVVTGAVKVVIGVFESLVGAVANAAKGIANFFGKAFEISAGILIASVINRIASEVRKLAIDIIQATSEFQLLDIRFKAIAARDIAREQMIPLADAFKLAGDRAEGLLRWVTQLAVQTPFTAQEIARTLALANAYGLTTGTAQVLTKATIDFASAMGLTEDHIFRIIYNFGQMQTIGRLTGREMRDLAISFVPINEILTEMGKRVNKTTKEMQELAFEGGVPAAEFFREFIDFIGKNFPGAAKAASRTFIGVISNLKEFAQSIVGLEVLGPTFDRITGKLADMLDVLLSPEFRKSADIIGQVLLGAFSRIDAAISAFLLPSLQQLAAAFGLTNVTATDFAVTIAKIGIGAARGIEQLAKIITNVAGFITDTLGGLSDNGHSWGYNLIASFARGMAAAVTAIVNIINSIARILSSWFKPGSPPKVAPDIDKWGEETGTLFVEGMGRPDVAGLEVLRDKVEKPVKEATKAVVDTAKEAGKELAKEMTAIARNTINSLSKFSADAMTALTSGFTSTDFGIFNDVASLMESFLRSLPEGQIGETALIPRILGTREAIASAIKDVRSGLASVDDAITRVMNAAGKATPAFRDYIRALFDVEAAQVALNRAQATFDAIQDLTTDNLYKIDRILKNITGDLRAQAEQFVAGLRQMAGIEKDLEFQQHLLNIATSKYERILNDLNAQLSQVTDQFTEQERLAQINEAIASGLLTRRELEKLQAEKRSIEIRQQIRQVEAERDAEVGAIEDRISAQEEAREQLQFILDEQKRTMTEVADLQRIAAEDQLAAAQEQLDASRLTIEMQIKQNELIQEQIDLLQRLAEQAKAAAGAGAGAEQFGLPLEFPTQALPTPEDVRKTIEGIFQTAREELDRQWQEIVKIFEDNFGKIDWQTLEDNARTAFTNIQTWWNTEMIPVFNFISLIATPALESIADSFDRIGNAISSLSDGNVSLGQFVAYLVLLASTPILAFLLALASVLSSVANTLERISERIETFNEQFREFQDNWEEAKGLPAKVILIMLEIWQGIKFGLGIMMDLLIGPWQGFFDFWFGMWETFRDKLVTHSLIPDMMADITSAILGGLADLILGVPGKIGELLAAFSGHAVEFISIGLEWVGGIISGIETATITLLETVGKLAGDVIAKVKEVFGIKSPATTMIEIGKSIIDGLILGITTAIAELVGAAMGTLAAAVLKPVQEEIDNNTGPAIKRLKDEFLTPLNNYITGTVTPTIIDLKDKAMVPLRDEILLSLIPAVTSLHQDYFVPLNDFLHTTMTETMDAMILNTGNLAERIGTDLIEAIDRAIKKLGEFVDAFDSAKTAMDTFVSESVDVVSGMNAIQKASSAAAAAVERLNKALSGKVSNPPKVPKTTTTTTTTGRGSRDVDLLASGGPAMMGRAYIVGELGPELFLPKVSGFVFPNKLLSRMVKSFAGLTNQPVLSQATQIVYNVDNSISVYVDANYAKTQSPSSIYWDVTAALAATRT